jgi:hypothetical protein
VLIFCYYILLSAGQAMAEQRLVPAVLGLWLRTGLRRLRGVRLPQAARERGIVSLERLEAWIAGVRARIAARMRMEAS